MNLRVVFVLIIALFGFLGGADCYCSCSAAVDERQDVIFADKQVSDVDMLFETAAETQNAIQQNVVSVVTTQSARVLSVTKRLMNTNLCFDALLLCENLQKSVKGCFSFTFVDFSLPKDYFIFFLRRIRI